MKANLSRMLRSGIAMLLVLCMTIGFVPTVVFADDGSAKETLNYVSIGDSMADGYCFEGYEQGNGDKIDFLNGKGVYGVDAYPLQFEEWLTEQGYDVNHTKLALSALRAEDLNYLLGGREKPNDAWENQPNGYAEVYDDAKLAAYFQEAVKNADIITLGIGNASFGAYLMHRVTDAVGLFGAELDEDEVVTLDDALAIVESDRQRDILLRAYNKLFNTMNDYVGDKFENRGINIKAICDLIAYTTAGFIVNYEAALDRIVELNPDVEIVIVGLMNTTYGLTVSGLGDKVLPVGELMDDFFKTLDLYTSGLPTVKQGVGMWKDAKFYFAAQPKPLFIGQEFGTLLENNWANIDDGRLSGAIVRDRNIDAYNEALRPLMGPAFVAGINAAIPAMIESMLSGNEAWDEMPEDERKAAIEDAVADVLIDIEDPTSYLFEITVDDVEAFEKASIRPVFGMDFNSDYNRYNLSIAIYLAMEKAIAESVSVTELTVDGLAAMATGNLGSIFDGISLDVASPDAVVESFADFMTSNATLKGLCKIYGMFKVGNGMAVHPTPAGHDQIAKAVIAAYDGDYTAMDHTMDTLYKLIKTYGPKVAKHIWNQWEKAGYTDRILENLDALQSKVQNRYTYYKNEVWPVLKAELVELKNQKDNLVKELATLNEMLEQKKAELDEVIKNTEIRPITPPDVDFDVELGNNPAQAPENDCTVDGESAKTELEAAIRDLEHSIAVLTALINDIDADIEDLIALGEEIGELIVSLGQTLEDISANALELRDAFKAIVKIMADESTAATAEQFMIAFEAAYSTALAAADVLKVSVSYADDVMEDIEKGAELMLAKSKVLYKKLRNTLPRVINGAPLKVKAALGSVLLVVTDRVSSVDEAKALIKKALVAIKNEYADDLAAAKADLKNKIDEKEAEIEARYEAVKAEFKAQIEELEAKKAALKAELKGYYEDLKNLPADAEQAVRDTIQAQIDRIESDLAMIEKDLEHIQNHLKNAYDAIVRDVEAAIEELKNKINEIEQAINDAMNNALDELIDTLIGIGKDLLGDMIDEIQNLLDQMLYNAFHGDILVGLNPKYVALGDGSAAANGYAEILANKFAPNVMGKLELVNAAKPGNTAAKEAANLSPEVAGADLITLGFSQTEIIAQALAAFMNGEVMDWNALVGEKVVPYVEKILAKVYEKIDSSVNNESAAEIIKVVAEAYAYGAAEYAINLPILINKIRAVNPTAEIVIVGMYNPVTDLVVEIDKGALGPMGSMLPIPEKIDMSEYAELFDYVVDVMYGYGAGLGLIIPDVTYVDAPAVEREKAVLGLEDLTALLEGNFSALYPNANGDAYIADRIYNALTLKLLGDANGDGVVDSYDASLIARYDVGLIGADALDLSVCDVNGDGRVNSYDASVVARYDVGLLAA